MFMRARRFTMVGAVMVVLSMIVAACSSSATTTTTTTQPESTTTTMAETTTTTVPLPKKPVGGEVVIAVDREPPTLNPFLPGGTSPVSALLAQAYAAGVYDIDGVTLSYLPELITEVPTVENGGIVLTPEGGMTVKYQIRPEAQWDDGVPVTGEDFKFTYDTIMDRDHPISKQNYQDIQAITVGEKSFEFTMQFPTVQHELMFSEILPKHIVEGTDFLTDWNDKRWASAGPFILDEWIKGESLTLVRNPNYWKIDPETGQQLPYLDKVTFLFKRDAAEMIESFTSRESDVISPEPTIENLDALRLLEPQGAEIVAVAGPVWEHLEFQFGPGRLERNENSCNEFFEMRIAVAQAIDKETLTTTIFGGDVAPLDSYIDPYAPLVSQHAWKQYEFDPQAAAANYAKANELAGRECSVVFTTNADKKNDTGDQMAVLLADMFAAAGIPFESQLEDGVTFFSDTVVAKGTFDLAAWAYQGSPGMLGLVGIHDYFDPDSPPPDNSLNRWGTEDSSVIDAATARYAEVRDAMNATVDMEELTRLVHEAENILADNLVIIPLYAKPVASAIWADRFAGFVHNPTPRAGFTWNIEFWNRLE